MSEWPGGWYLQTCCNAIIHIGKVDLICDYLDLKSYIFSFVLILGSVHILSRAS
jgi:hypothetical protein